MKKKLTEMAYKENAFIASIEKDIMHKVSGMGVRVGKRVEMITKQPLKGPLTISIEGTHTSLGRGVAEKIVVSPVRSPAFDKT
ncbi:MAG: ferrous iron transport protein A [Candidatus Omnitrophica bacterium]|nr:ferrous iron transport protein A [Candidatus Omnitrophota bacterium]